MSLIMTSPDKGLADIRRVTPGNSIAPDLWKDCISATTWLDGFAIDRIRPSYRHSLVGNATLRSGSLGRGLFNGGTAFADRSVYGQDFDGTEGGWDDDTLWLQPSNTEIANTGFSIEIVGEDFGTSVNRGIWTNARNEANVYSGLNVEIDLNGKLAVLVGDGGVPAPGSRLSGINTLIDVTSSGPYHMLWSMDTATALTNWTLSVNGIHDFSGSGSGSGVSYAGGNRIMTGSRDRAGVLNNAEGLIYFVNIFRKFITQQEAKQRYERFWQMWTPNTLSAMIVAPPPVFHDAPSPMNIITAQ